MQMDELNEEKALLLSEIDALKSRFVKPCNACFKTFLEDRDKAYLSVTKHLKVLKRFLKTVCNA